MNDAFIIILTGTLVAVCCGLLGCFLILRNLAMMGDAISHAVLPGIVITYLISGSRDSLTMLIGAGAVGIFTSFLIEYFTRKAKLQSDAAIGVTFTWLFALGVILISLYAGQVDIDQECVLYGEIAYVPLDTWVLDSGLDMGPRVIWLLGGLLTVLVAGLFLAYKELQITTFDPSYAVALGFSTMVWHYALMGAVSFTTVAAFESVGAILVVAFLVVLPATAYLLTTRLPIMLLLTALLGLASAIVGYYAAVWLNSSIAGTMATCAGVFFTLALLFSPEEGLVVKALRRRKVLEMEEG